MGTVFLGEHALIGRRAAIKVLRPELAAKRGAVDRFFNEARAAAAISDPGIVQVFDFGVAVDGVAYIVMELLEGEPLNLRLKRLGALPFADALRITRQVAGSLGATHAAGIVHRDLKPENLYIVRDPEAAGGERPKILDFGIAKLSDAGPDRVHTRTGAVLGTPLYMSPEQCDGAGRVDHRTDIYSLGCVLFHLLTGRPPFDQSGMGALISAHMRDPAPAPSSLAPHLSPELDELVLRCLAKSPDERFGAMLELQQACDAMLARVTTGAGLLPLTPESPEKSMVVSPIASHTSPDVSQTTLSTSAGQSLAATTRRRFGLLVACGALAAGAGVGAAVMSMRSSGYQVPGDGTSHGATTVPDTAVAAERPDAGPAPVVVAPVTITSDPPGIPGDAREAAATETFDERSEEIGGGDPAGFAGGAGGKAPRGEDDASRSEPPTRPPPAAGTRKPAATQPARPRSKPRTYDLYDDRN